MELNAIIVDDEEQSRKSLFFLLNAYCPTVKIRGIACSVAEARSLLRLGDINLVFLDIAMPAEDGFCLLPYLEDGKASVVFTTAHNQYAIRAIKASALEYLLKPIDLDDLKTAVSKATKTKMLFETLAGGQASSIPLNTLSENLNESKQIVKLNLPNANGFRVVYLKELLYVQADSNYSIFHLSNQEKILVSKHLKEYENILQHSGFSRIHKSMIINLAHLKNFSHRNGLKVKLSDNSEHPVSRRRSPAFMTLIKQIFPR